MGQKAKKGKQRKDKFYHLAKESGYRARSAFKLIQLDRKLRLLESARVAIDLCAAPGGWLQVLQNCMPVSSIIIGVDLVPIKPIPNVITIQDDITADSCSSSISKHLQSWKADIVLNDGAPNVGQSWIQDAFTQSQLTLAAFKLATKFLKKGGCFVTKIFRSKDYLALNWAFKQLFLNVKATKPQASRNESAEIYVICQNFKAPDKIDPKFFDIKHVFKDLTDPDAPNANVDKLLIGQPATKAKPKALGYSEDTLTVYKQVPITKFLTEENYIPILNFCSELRFDDEDVASHPLTTDDIKDLCKDVQILNKKDVKLLLKWRSKMRTTFSKKLNTPETPKDPVHSNQPVALTEEEKETQLEDYLTRADKKRKAKLREQKLKMRQKMALGATALIEEDQSLFSLTQMKSKKQLDAYEESNNIDVDDVEKDVEEAGEEKEPFASASWQRAKSDHSTRNEWMKDLYSDEELSLEDSDEEDETELIDTENEVEDAEVQEDDAEEEEEAKLVEDPNPLLATGNQNLSAVERAQQWYASHEVFAEVPIEEDADLDLEKELSDDEAETSKKGKKKKKAKGDLEGSVKSTVCNEGDELVVAENARLVASLALGKKANAKHVQFEDEVSEEEMSSESEQDSESDASDFEVSEKSSKQTVKRKLTPEQLALGHEIAFSAKRRREIIESGFHRFAYHDENELPKWFKHEEFKHTRPIKPVSKELVKMYRERLKEINARPIKKVAEAKARKKMKTMKKLESIRGKAEKIASIPGASEREKLLQIKGLYKKAKVDKKLNKDKTYVVAKKKGSKAVNPSKKKGKKGPVKFVDRRLKADKHKEKQKLKSNKGKKSKSSKPQKVHKMRHVAKNRKR